jgi:uncharacterized protein (TIGR02444 family)
MLMAGEAAAEGFWRFSLMVYARPGIADALIRLQDRDGHNVNLILFGLWLGLCEGMRLDTAGLGRARAAIAGIDRDVVTPLRRLRRALRSDSDLDVRELRRRVLALELAAERRVQARLAASAGPRNARRSGGHALAEANLRLILGGDFGLAEVAVLLASLSLRGGK